MIMRQAQATEFLWLQEVGIEFWDVWVGWNQEQIRGRSWQVTLEELGVCSGSQFTHT